VEDAMTTDETFEVLELIGYRGIPQRESIKSVKAIIQ
jgi:hypothetical protein